MRVRCFAVLAAAVCAVAGAAAGEPGDAALSWQDIESRIQYGYFTEDAHALDGVREQLAATDAQDKLKNYYAGLLDYRLMQLSVATIPRDKAAAQAARARARELLGSCIASLNDALKIQKDFAEALALLSACRGMAAQQTASWLAPFSAMRSASEIRRALQLAPDNPRVLLLQAMADDEHARATGEPAQDKTLKELKKAIAGFEAERREVERVPGWGAVDAYFLLARISYERGDAITARDALERALLLAPQFVQARRLLYRITSS